MWNAIFWIIAMGIVLFVAYKYERYTRRNEVDKWYVLAHAMIDTILIFLLVIVIMSCIFLIKTWYFA